MAAISLTRDEVKQLAKDLLDEKGSLFWSDSLLNTLANEANRDVWREIIRVNSEYFLATDSFTWAAGAERIDMEATFAKKPYKVLTLEDTPSSGAIAASNLPRKWMPMRFSERAKHLSSAGLYNIREAFHYCTQGKYLYVAPLIQETLNVTAYTIPYLEEMTAGGDVVLGDRADMFQDAVYKRLAYLMNIKQNGNNPIVDRLWQEAVIFIENNAETRQIDEPLTVKVLGHY